YLLSQAVNICSLEPVHFRPVFKLLPRSMIAEATAQCQIIAVTGEEAAQVNRLAADAQRKLETINAGTDRAKKDAALKAFSTELNQLEMSVLSKAELNEAFSTIWKKHGAEVKAKRNAETKLVQDTVTPYFSTERPNATFLARHFLVGSNTKALQAGILVAKQLNKAIYLFSEEALPSDSEAQPQAAEEDAGRHTRQGARGASQLCAKAGPRTWTEGQGVGGGDHEEHRWPGGWERRWCGGCG
ncbi:hypothetical protein CF335_g8411, partial [Tilletia laevis]